MPSLSRAHADCLVGCFSATLIPEIGVNCDTTLAARYTLYELTDVYDCFGIISNLEAGGAGTAKEGRLSNDRYVKDRRIPRSAKII